MQYIRSFLFNAYLTVVLYPSLFLFSLLVFAPWQWCNWIPAWWGRRVTKTLKLFIGLRAELKGHLPPPNQPVLIISKHQSSWETHVFPALFPYSAFVVKQELMNVPAYGWLLKKLGMIPVNRGKGMESIRNMSDAAKKRIAERRSIIVFPEGTRTEPGAKVNYKSGVYLLYKVCNVPVVPIALNSGCFWGRRSFLKRPGTITVECLEHIPPGLSKNEFMKKIHDQIEGKCHTLNQKYLRKNKKASL